MSFIAELKRRNVFRAAAAYVAVAWLVVQVAEAILPAFGLGEAGLRIVVILLAIGLVPALALSWAFELTPEGWKRDQELEPGGALSRRTNRLLDRGIVVVLALGVAYFAFDKFVLGPAREAVRVEAARQEGRTAALVESYGDKSIAVLPFANMSADPEQVFFSDGMAEEILNLLARIPELRVISRSSAFTFRDSPLKLDEIAATLNVAYILEGSVRRAGDQVRVTAQLIEARSDTHLWSASWDRGLPDIFAIQDEIAAEVVSHLKLKLLGDLPTARRVDAVAYTLYMQAMHMLDQQAVRDHGLIHGFLQRAIELDPDYADPWTGVAWVYYSCYIKMQDAGQFCASVPPGQATALSIEAIETALSIEPDNATAIAYRAFHIASRQGDLSSAAKDFERAIQLAPTTNVLRSAIIFARLLHRPEVAVRLGEYLVARDPLCSICAYQLARAHLEAGQFDRSESLMRAFARSGRGGWHSIGTALVLAGKPEAALEAFEMQSQPEQSLHGRAIALHSQGRYRESAEALAALESGWANAQPQLLAEVYAWTGDLQLASDWLERALELPEGRELFGLRFTSPFLQPVLELPSWQAYLRERGLAAEQLAEIPFDPILPDG